MRHQPTMGVSAAKPVEHDANAQQQREIRFGRRLAANEKKTRDKAVKKLKAWLARQESLTELDNRKIWRGLFYAMWMSDKPLVQEELAEELADLIHVLPSPGAALGFAAGFFDIMGRDWGNIDRLRLDKFYALVKRCLHGIFVMLRETGWEDGVLEAFAGMLEAGLLATNSKYSRGLKWFVAEQYFPMLAEADNESATMPTVAILIRPWLLLLSKENDKIFRGKIQQHIFDAALNGTAGVPVDLGALSHAAFAMAAEPSISPPNRSLLYHVSKTAKAKAPPAPASPKRPADPLPPASPKRHKGAGTDGNESKAPAEHTQKQPATKEKAGNKSKAPAEHTSKQPATKEKAGNKSKTAAEHTPKQPATKEKPGNKNKVPAEHTPQQPVAVAKHAAATETKAARRPPSHTGPVPSSEPSAKPRVKIVLEHNRVSEFNKKHRVARPDSPAAFDPTRKPVSGVLKSTPSTPLRHGKH